MIPDTGFKDINQQWSVRSAIDRMVEYGKWHGAQLDPNQNMYKNYGKSKVEREEYDKKIWALEQDNIRMGERIRQLECQVCDFKENILQIYEYIKRRG